MKDEEYAFYQDVKEKKSVSWSARKKRTHCGKGGRVRLPSDNLTKKELKKMNGECKTYRLNSPMKWDEFKSMPFEHQETYLKLLRKKYNVSDAQLAKMFGISQGACSHYLKKIGLSRSRTFSGKEVWDKEGFYAWAYGVPKTEEGQSVQEEVKDDRPAEVTRYDAVAEEIAQAERQPESMEEIAPYEDVECYETVEEPLDPVPFEEKEPVPVFETPDVPITPCSGTMSFEGRFEDVLKAVGVLIGSASGKIHIAWDVQMQNA